VFKKTLRLVALTSACVVFTASGQEPGFLASDMYCKEMYLNLKERLANTSEYATSERQRLTAEITSIANSCQAQHDRNLLNAQAQQERKQLAAQAEEERKQLAAQRERADLQRAQQLAKLPGVKIGMSADTVRNKTSWGAPATINRTTTASGTKEQWVYGGGNYLYFENGRLTAIQN
jgi:hypothetical protein